ncbi:unnamed protein product [Nyctereutes procyonoides]|uniref:(raccoon dog) hypothetical protein n=1 Tax=Nyctereutes procyonoides TaxID=34880 RepID=A0A811Z2C0_NYCPR|nr:unnamed protein product [Nyctereutes procyonoides]
MRPRKALGKSHDKNKGKVDYGGADINGLLDKRTNREISGKRLKQGAPGWLSG